MTHHQGWRENYYLHNFRRVLHCYVRNFFIEPRQIHSGKKDKEKEEYGLLSAVIYFMPPLSPLQLPPPHTAHLSHRLRPRRISWRGTPPPPHPRTPHGGIKAVFSDLGQNRGRPPFRGLKVLQLNLDSNCDYVRIFCAVIGHLEAEIDFWIFPRK